MLKQILVCYVLLISFSFFTYQSRAFVVCLVPDFPFTICPNQNATSDYLSTEVFGFDVDMFRYVATSIGWEESMSAAAAPPESGRFVFNCLDNFYWGQVTTSMTTPTQATFDHCAASLGSFTINTARVQAHAQFSYPYMGTGLGVMVMIQRQVYNWWAFITPFDGLVWLCYGLIVLLVPSCIWLVERLNTVGYVSLSHDSMAEWKDSSYQSLLAVFNIALLKVYSLPSQLLIVVFLFTNLIVVATYTANLAAALTSGNYFTTTLSDPSQLYGATVATYDSYVDRVYKQYTGTVIVFNGSSEENIMNAMEYLRKGTIVAFLYDRVAIQRLLPTYDTACEFMLLDGVVEPFDYGVIFHMLFNSTVIQQFSDGVLGAVQDDTISNLQTKYMPPYSTCAGNSSNSVVIQQLAGLFIILACAICVSILWTAFNVFLRIRAVIRAEADDMCETGKPSMDKKPSYAEVLKDVFIPANREQTFVPMSSKRTRANSISIAGRSFSRSCKMNPTFNSSTSLAIKSFNQTIMRAPITRTSTMENPSMDQVASSINLPTRYTLAGAASLRTSSLPEETSTDQMASRAAAAGRPMHGSSAMNAGARTSTLSEQPSENYSGSLGGLRFTTQSTPPTVAQSTPPTVAVSLKTPGIADRSNVGHVLSKLGKDSN